MNEIPKNVIIITSILTQRIGAVELTHSSSAILPATLPKVPPHLERLMQTALKTTWAEIRKQAEVT